MAGNGTFTSAEYNCNVSPSVIPGHVELRYDFHALNRSIVYMWCAEDEGNPALLSLDQKQAAYAGLTKIMSSEHESVDDIVAKLKQTSSRPDSVLRAMAEAIFERETHKHRDAADAVYSHLDAALRATESGFIDDISLEDAKILAKDIMDSRIMPSCLDRHTRSKKIELSKFAEGKEADVPSVGTGGGEVEEKEGEKEEGVEKQPGKNAKRNVARKAAKKAKRAQNDAGDREGEGEVGTSAQI